ncbi:predicted protein [Nematostella vectensis]|uniref:Uncharacterized protein n=2 Tax=Nematostella vectensis TaxID=45351 RepID=A7RMR4_NEMVE|nr:predicted protein [Nematostella vectensis]|eukprot:XP_001639377.1 predicted protein [Nematostella vectensis]
MGCDVFFNLPLHPNPVTYTYQLVNIPVQVMYLGPGKMVKVTCEWMKHFAWHLQQGWKLAEIFWDQGKRSHGDFTLSGDHNSVWFFEKESARASDPTPVYEGVIIEYKHTVKIGFFQTKAKGDWGPMISEMGSRGWELACMLETPEVTNIGLGNITFKILFFFQRRILQGQPPPGTYYPPPPQGNYNQYPVPGGQNYAGAPPPPYYPPQEYQAPPPYNPNSLGKPSAPPHPEKF